MAAHLQTYYCRDNHLLDNPVINHRYAYNEGPNNHLVIRFGPIIPVVVQAIQPEAPAQVG